VVLWGPFSFRIRIRIRNPPDPQPGARICRQTGSKGSRVPTPHAILDIAAHSHVGLLGDELALCAIAHPLGTCYANRLLARRERGCRDAPARVSGRKVLSCRVVDEPSREGLGADLAKAGSLARGALELGRVARYNAIAHNAQGDYSCSRII